MSIVKNSIDLIKRAEMLQSAYDSTKQRADLNSEDDLYQVSSFVSKSGESFNLYSHKVEACKKNQKYDIISKAVFADGTEYMITEMPATSFFWISTFETQRALHLDAPTTLDLEKDMYVVMDCDKTIDPVIACKYTTPSIIRHFLRNNNFKCVSDIKNDNKLRKYLNAKERLLDIDVAKKYIEDKMAEKQESRKDSDPVFDKNQPEYFSVFEKRANDVDVVQDINSIPGGTMDIYHQRRGFETLHSGSNSSDINSIMGEGIEFIARDINSIPGGFDNREFISDFVSCNIGTGSVDINSIPGYAEPFEDNQIDDQEDWIETTSEFGCVSPLTITSKEDKVGSEPSDESREDRTFDFDNDWKNWTTDMGL